MSEETVPRLDLAPRRKRPLALWNPWDYLVLLYWVFFFPQAIRWYVETFVDPRHNEREGLEHLSIGEQVPKRLAFQAVLATVIAVTILLRTSDITGFLMIVTGVIFGACIGAIVGAASPVISKAASSIVFGVALGLTNGWMFGAAYEGILVSIVRDNIADSDGGALGALIGYLLFSSVMMSALALTIAYPCQLAIDSIFSWDGIKNAITYIGLSASSIPIFVGIVLYSKGLGFETRDVKALVVIVLALLVLTRVPDWFIGHLFSARSHRYLWSRMAWLPLSPIKRQLRTWLDLNWVGGIYNAKQYMAYSLQSPFIINIVNLALERSSRSSVLSRVADIADRPCHWNLIFFCSADFGNALRQQVIEALIPVDTWRRRLQARYPVEPCLDSPARCACAGFWFWHQEDSAHAAEAFEKIRTLPHGEELYGIAQALAVGGIMKSLKDLASMPQHFVWLDSLRDSELRPGSLQAFYELRTVTQEVATADSARSDINISLALARGSKKLRELIETGQKYCPEPEWHLVRKVAELWLDILIRAAGEAGEAVLHKAIDNPYLGYSGLPVEPPAFVGRHATFRRIETCWATTDALVPIFLYGHRRMGKTSILRNLENVRGASTLLVYLDMHDAGWVDHTGELLLDFAEAIHDKASFSGLDAGAPPTVERFTNLGAGRRELNALLKGLAPQMAEHRLILAIDEFEAIEGGIADRRIDAGLVAYLRSINQQHRWLGLIFGGLHTLEEMGRDYKSAFWGQAEHIRVSYLSYDATVDLVARPHPDFALEYADDLLAELHRLTHGQPYLLQRLCWELVNGWNERFLVDGEKTPRVLELGTLEGVLDPDFYRGAEYYFDGVWQNVTAGEREVLPALAARAEPWPRADVPADEDVLELLLRHDVVLEDDRGVRFASELLRRWILQREVE